VCMDVMLLGRCLYYYIAAAAAVKPGFQKYENHALLLSIDSPTPIPRYRTHTRTHTPRVPTIPRSSRPLPHSGRPSPVCLPISSGGRPAGRSVTRVMTPIYIHTYNTYTFYYVYISYAYTIETAGNTLRRPCGHHFSIISCSIWSCAFVLQQPRARTISYRDSSAYKYNIIIILSYAYKTV